MRRDAAPAHVVSARSQNRGEVCGSVNVAPVSDSNDPKDPRATVRLDPAMLKPTWPIVIASLEQLAEWSVLALRLGTLALINECVRELAQREARKEVVVRLQALVEALAHMPYEA